MSEFWNVSLAKNFIHLNMFTTCVKQERMCITIVKNTVLLILFDVCQKNKRYMN